MTERMRLEQRYRHSIDLRRATLDGLTEGIAVFGANGLLQFVNEAFHEIWGTDGDMVYAAMHARQLIGLCEEIAGGPEVWQKLHGFITGEENRRAWTAHLETGTGRVLTARFAPLPDGSTLAVFADVTRFERVSEALLEHEAALELTEAARRAIDDLVSHRSLPALETIEAIGALPAIAPSDGATRAGSHIGTAAAELRGALESTARIVATPLDPAGTADRGGTVETLGLVAEVAGIHAGNAGVSLSADAVEAPRRVACPPARLGQIAWHLAMHAVARSVTGGTVVLRAEGSDERFCLHADCSVLLPPAPGAGDGDRLVRLVALQGGLVEIEQETPGGHARITCRFHGGPSESGASAPAQNAAAPGDGGTVHTLKPRTG